MGRHKSLNKKNLISIHITEEIHNLIMARRQRAEPIWRVLERIFASYLEGDNQFWEKKYTEQCEITNRWVNKYNDLKRQLQSTLNVD
jgi:hypothetical protein